jgi:hypothetical protein
MDLDVSIIRCDTRFGCYGMFATLSLRTAVVNRNHWNRESYRSALRRSLRHQPTVAICELYLQSLSFPDSDFFNFEELAFLMQLRNPFLPRTAEQIESDRRTLTHEASTGDRIFRSHARILLKAINFWELRHAEKWEEWRDTYSAALAEEQRRNNVPSEVQDEPLVERSQRRYYPRRTRRNGNIVVDTVAAATAHDVDEGYGSS